MSKSIFSEEIKTASQISIYCEQLLGWLLITFLTNPGSNLGRISLSRSGETAEFHHSPKSHYASLESPSEPTG